MARGIPKNGINKGWFKKGSSLSLETRLKMSVSKRGKSLSDEHKAKIKKNHSHYWRGKKMPYTEEWRRAIGESRRGYKHTEETRKKMSEAHKGCRSHWWRGGVSSKNELARKTVEYKLWREAVFKRDDYTCQTCGLKNKKGLGKSIKIHADHIKPFAFFPELRFCIDNGVTLCINCHKKTPTYGGGAFIYKFKKIADENRR